MLYLTAIFSTLLKSSFLVIETFYSFLTGGDLRLHDLLNRSPRDWVSMQPNQVDKKMNTLALIETFRQMALKSGDLNGSFETRFGRGEFAAALWPVELVAETDIIDPDKGSGDDGAGLNGLLPREVHYRTGATTEMVARRWNQTSVSVRRTRDNQPPDLLLEELQKLSQLRHPGNKEIFIFKSYLGKFQLFFFQD